MILFLRLSGISLGRYCRKSIVKGEGFGKKDKKEGWPWEGFKPTAHFVLTLTSSCLQFGMLEVKSVYRFVLFNIYSSLRDIRRLFPL